MSSGAARRPRGGRLHSITTRLIVWIAGAGALVLGAVLWREALDTHELLERAAREHAQTAAHGVVSSLRAVVRGVESGARALGATVRTTALTDDEVHDLIKGFVHDSDAIYGGTIAYAPGEFAGATEGMAPYYHRSGSGLTFTNLAAPGAEYWTKSWYWEPASTGRQRWSEPELDPRTDGIRTVTFSLPVARPSGEVIAVVMVDISLDWLREHLQPRLEHLHRYGERDGGQEPLVEVIVLSRSGRFVSYPEQQRLLDDEDEDAVSASPEILAIARRMMAGEEGFASFQGIDGGDQRWLYYAPVPSPGWSVGALFYESRVLAPARKKQRADLVQAAVGIIVLIAVVALLARRITGPLRGLGATAAAIGSGDLDAVVEGSGAGDEVDALADALRRMQADLKEHMAQLASETTARARIETELKAARNIQLAMLPHGAPPASDQAAYDLAATLISAREVGGDLYDFFTLRDGRIAFAVGDVSGKGVPAALFMARTLTLFKLACRDEPGPGAVLARLNAELEIDNDACMFVTMFCGVLDPATGRLCCANAGHNPPVIAGIDGARMVEIPGGAVLGVVDGMTYPETELQLSTEEVLLVYTDGVTEAVGAAGKLYGDERLLQSAGLAPRSGRGMLDAILHGVETFSAGKPQADDITLLALRTASPPGVWESLPGPVLTLRSDGAALDEARVWLESMCSKAGIDESLTEDVLLVSEEVLANIVQHAHGRDASRTMELRARALGTSVFLGFRDSGPAYNPLEAPAPDLAAAPEDREIGGLGVHLVKRLASRVDHAREAEHNVLLVLCGGPA